MTESLLGTTPTAQPVRISKKSRRKGLYVAGATGTGKSTLFENLCIQDITQNIGVCLLDPHGDLVDRIISRMPEKKLDDVILIDIGNTEQVFSVNLMECHNYDIKSMQQRVDQVFHIFDLLYDISRTTPMMAQTLRNASYTIIANRLTFAEMPRLLLDWEYRRRLLHNVTHKPTLEYWARFEGKNKLDRDREVEATLNKLDEMLQPVTLNMIAQKESSISLGEIMDKRQILLVKLDARMPYVSSLVGAILIAKILNAAYERRDMLPEQRIQFSVYADEAGRFATPDFKLLLTEARKYGISTTLATQTLSQIAHMQNEVLQAGSLVVFRVTGEDAAILSRQCSAHPKPEWHERKEEDILDGEEEIKTPVKDVVGQLLRGGTHRNPVVNDFATGWLRDVESGASGILPTLNTILYNAMTGKPLPTEYYPSFFSTLFIRGDGSAFGKGTRGYSHITLCLRPGGSTNLAYQAFLQYFLTDNPVYLTRFYAYVKDFTQQYLKSSLAQFLHALRRHYESIYILYAGDDRPPPDKEPPKEILAELQKECDRRIKWFPLNVSSLTWELKCAYSFVGGSGQTHYSDTTYDFSHFQHYYWKPVPGQEETCYRPAELVAEVARICTEEKECFEERLAELKAVMQALAEHPLETGSGLTRPRIRKQINWIAHPQQTVSDAQADIANKLATQPDMTFHARIETGEYDLTVTRSNEGVKQEAWDNRLQAIITQNLAEKYLRKRAEVEKELSVAAQPIVKEVVTQSTTQNDNQQAHQVKEKTNGKPNTFDIPQGFNEMEYLLMDRKKQSDQEQQAQQIRPQPPEPIKKQKKPVKPKLEELAGRINTSPSPVPPLPQSRRKPVQ